MILKKEVIDKDDQRLVQLDLSNVQIAENVISFAVLAVTVTKNEDGGYSYGMDLTSRRDEGEPSESELITDEISPKEENAAEILIRRALKLIMDEMQEASEKEKEALEKPN